MLKLSNTAIEDLILEVYGGSMYLPPHTILNFKTIGGSTDLSPRPTQQDFQLSCALSMNTSDLNLEHFIPASWGHGGTYQGNVYPAHWRINRSKSTTNPFVWIERKDVKKFGRCANAATSGNKSFVQEPKAINCFVLLVEALRKVKASLSLIFYLDFYS